jgi:hypothetical protein
MDINEPSVNKLSGVRYLGFLLFLYAYPIIIFQTIEPIIEKIKMKANIIADF